MLRTLLVTALLALLCAGTASAQAGARTATPTVVKLYVIHSHGEVLALVKLKIDRHPFVFALDTGAAGSLIDAKAAKVFHLPKEGSQKAAGVKCTFVSRTVRVSDWSIGAIKLQPQTLATSQLPFRGIDGLLGSDVLSRYSTVQIDYEHGLLKLGAPRIKAKTG